MLTDPQLFSDHAKSNLCSGWWELQKTLLTAPESRDFQNTRAVTGTDLIDSAVGGRHKSWFSRSALKGQCIAQYDVQTVIWYIALTIRSCSICYSYTWFAMSSYQPSSGSIWKESKCFEKQMVQQNSRHFSISTPRLSLSVIVLLQKPLRFNMF